MDVLLRLPPCLQNVVVACIPCEKKQRVHCELKTKLYMLKRILDECEEDRETRVKPEYGYREGVQGKPTHWMLVRSSYTIDESIGMKQRSQMRWIELLGRGLWKERKEVFDALESTE